MNCYEIIEARAVADSVALRDQFWTPPVAGESGVTGR